MRWRRWTLDQDRRKATDSGIDTWAALAKAGRSALDPARSGRIGAGSAQLRRAGASIPKRRDPRQEQGISPVAGGLKIKKAQFANCVLALCVIDEIVINSMTSGKIMEIRPPVS